MAVLEALASGTAVMLSPGCNMNEVEPAGAGLIVEADAEVMAHALADLLSDRERLRQMGEAGRRLVVEKYSWDLVTDRLVATYEEGIARSRAAALR